MLTEDPLATEIDLPLPMVVRGATIWPAVTGRGKSARPIGWVERLTIEIRAMTMEPEPREVPGRAAVALRVLITVARICRKSPARGATSRGVRLSALMLIE